MEEHLDGETSVGFEDALLRLDARLSNNVGMVY